MSGRCCTGECRQGRDCPERREVRLNRPWLLILAGLALFWTAVLAAVVRGCAS